MENNKLLIIMWAVSLLLVAALTYFIFLHFNKPEVVERPVQVLVPGKDSVIVKNHYYYYPSETSHADVKNDTASTVVKDVTVFGKDTLYSEINAKYSLADSNFVIARGFDLKHSSEFRVDTLKIYNYEIKEVEKDIPFYKEPYFNYGLGVITSLLILIFGNI